MSMSTEIYGMGDLNPNWGFSQLTWGFDSSPASTTSSVESWSPQLFDSTAQPPVTNTNQVDDLSPEFLWELSQLFPTTDATLTYTAQPPAAGCEGFHDAGFYFNSPTSSTSSLSSTDELNLGAGAVTNVKRRRGQRVSGLTRKEAAHDVQLGVAGVSLIKCLWADCEGSFYDDRTSFNAHCRAMHKIHSSKERQSCLWAGCAATCGELKRHVWSHMHAAEVECDVCHEVLSRSDALKRHKRAGTCLRCPKEGCGAQFASFEERQAHELFCDPVSQKVVQGGKQGRKGKKAKDFWPY
jgi:hypothetical protein